MFGMIRRYLRGRARIIAKTQMKNALKKVAKSIRDGNDCNDSAISNAIKGSVGSVRKKSALSQIMAIIVSASLIMPYNVNASAVDGTVHDPQRFAQAYAQFVEQIEKYNNMIKTAQDTLDTMNRINDIMNTANKTLNNLQVGLADPRQLAERFQANLESIKENAERLGKSLEERNWGEQFLRKEFASCQKKWQNLVKEMKAFEEQQLNEETGKFFEEGGTDEEKAKELAQKYEDSAKAKEIEADLKAVEDHYNGVNTAVSDKLNYWANQAQYYINFTDVETKMMQHKNPYRVQTDVCNMVEEESKLRMRQYQSAYWKAVAEGNYTLAKKEFEKWRIEGLKQQQKKLNDSKKVHKTAKAQFNQNADKKPILDINEDTGELIPKDKWVKLGLGFDTTAKAAKKEKIPQPADKDGNVTFVDKWVAKPETIKDLFDSGYINEALNLQRKRAMVMALQGDALAVQKTQLETAQMLGMQINYLTNSVNQIGYVINRFLEMEYKEKEDNLKEYVKDENNPQTSDFVDISATDVNFKAKLEKNMQDMGFGKFEDILEDDTNTGRIKFKNTIQDTSVITD